MGQIRIGGQVFSPRAVVFDKDGLLFDSQHFLIALARVRYEAMRNILPDGLLCQWLREQDIVFDLGHAKELVITGVKRDGFMSLAPPDQEAAQTAIFLSKHMHMPQADANSLAEKLYHLSDQKLKLSDCIKPRKGFPAIFARLRNANIPYGIATADDRDRAVRSVDLFDHSEYLSFLVTPRDVKNPKPAPDMLRLIARQMNLGTTELMMVGDSFVDMQMAQSVGAAGVGIPETDSMSRQMRPYAGVIVQSLDDIQVFP